MKCPINRFIKSHFNYKGVDLKSVTRPGNNENTVVALRVKINDWIFDLIFDFQFIIIIIQFNNIIQFISKSCLLRYEG